MLTMEFQSNSGKAKFGLKKQWLYANPNGKDIILLSVNNSDFYSFEKRCIAML